MPKLLRSEFRPLAPQQAFLTSTAKIRGYGGAMGGGKSRTLCEDAFTVMLDYPGIVVLLCRAQHTSIVETTKKTMLAQVVPSELIARTKASMGEDYVELWNGSRCHFVGLDNPLRWYSAEIGLLGFDEAQEIHEDAAVRLITRLRQPGMPHRASFTFNPSSPGHWLQRWFLLGGEQTAHGFYKQDLFATEAISPLGSAEFFFAKAADNTYLPEGYVEQTLGGLPERLRRRYLDGLWEFTEGNSFFDPDALGFYERVAHDTKASLQGRTVGDPVEDFLKRSRHKHIASDARCRFVKDSQGRAPWTVWRAPKPDHRYVMAIDTSSGGSYDWSAIQIVSVEEFEQVAELQVKLTPTEVAVEAYRAGRVFNDALAVPEITGGWGFTVEQELKRLHYPRLHTRKVLDRLSRKWTDRTGFDTTVKTRRHILDTLEKTLREKEFGLYSLRAVSELATFVYGKDNKPQAQDGCNDDLVMALAIAVTIAVDMPRTLRKPLAAPRAPQFAATGY